MADAPPVRPKRTVASRVLLSYAVVTAVFAISVGWSVVALRNASREADLMRSGYLPLALALRNLVANQDTWNTQLNHVTRVPNPVDKRVWFELALRFRPQMFGEVRAAISGAFITSRDPNVEGIGRELLAQTSGIEQQLSGDRAQLTELFGAIDQADGSQAERVSAEMVTRGSQAKERLSALERRVQRNVDVLLDAARARERRAIQLLIGLSVFAAMVGVMMALYAQRLLRPLAAVTARAKAVARGDLTPRPVVASSDEIGELATTFEGMVSAIARANEQLLATERLATIGKMAAHVTHEIRNPLSSIGLNLELLEDDLGAGDGEAQVLVRAIKAEVERLNALSEQYLSVAKRQPLRLEEEDVGEIIREACDFMRRELGRHGVEARLDFAEGSLTARVDEAQVKQAIINLMRNAREAMPSGGTITVGVRASQDGLLEITVDDTGSGLDEGARERLFEPFFTTKGHGTGLGLAITRQIVEAHGGSIACEARPGGGTRFRLTLARGPSAAPAPGEPPTSGALSGSG